MQSGYISFNRSTIHYLRSGQGKKILVAFHGYGESASNFNFLSEKVKDDFTLIALDLPFHGQTEWNEPVMHADDIRSIILKILETENLSSPRITLIGFSLGGRLALSVYEIMPELVEKLVLLAPDGLKLNFWYWLSTQTSIGNKSFKYTMSHPSWFLGMLTIGNRVGLINRSIYKFVDYYIHDDQVRKELFNRWTCLRKCKPDLEHIRNDIRKFQTGVRLIYGKHDRIILSSPAQKFIRNLENVKLEVLDCGHQVLHSKNAQQIAKALIE